ncbi:MAG: glyoxylase-like metal-dependent hydrolase (beta-lactamase superfamily II) [Paraglaciecola psychrophila]|jgi:glyoxylase-like metal-dependent hydrolase (beta-lactamase superfamily II)
MQLHQVKTRLVNSTVIEYHDRILVIDVAKRCEHQVLHFVESDLGRPASDIALVLCTHDDPDHIGGISALAQLSGAATAIPYASTSATKKFYRDPSGGLVRFATSLREATRARAWKMYLKPSVIRGHRNHRPIAPTTQRQQPHHILKHGHSPPGFDDWETIHTPGHSWDSCCYFHRASGALITGDTLLGSGSIGQLVTPAIYANSRHLKASLQKLKNLPVSVVYPGHGSVMRGAHLFERF